MAGGTRIPPVPDAMGTESPRFAVANSLVFAVYTKLLAKRMRQGAPEMCLRWLLFALSPWGR